MSYILDALRKADAQRERDPARGIHAQPVRLGTGEQRVQERYRTGWWAATAAGVAALAIGGWILYEDQEAAPNVPAARTEVAVATPAPAVVVAPPQPAAAVLPPPVVVAPPVAAPPPVLETPATAAKPAPVPAPPAAARSASGGAAASPAVPPRASPTPAAAAVASAPPAAAVANVPAVVAPPAAAPVSAPAPAAAEAAAPIAGLPADAPKLAISGGVYSANAAQRMLIVNGQVLNEGVEIGPGMVLEEIRPKAAVLRFRGSRYTVPY